DALRHLQRDVIKVAREPLPRQTAACDPLRNARATSPPRAGRFREDDQARSIAESVRSAATSSSSRGSSKLQLHLSNCLVGRRAIVRLELQSDSGIGFTHEHRSVTRRVCGFHIPLRENACADLPFRRTENSPDQHNLSGGQVLAALADYPAVLLFRSRPRRLETARHFVPASWPGLTNVQVSTPKLAGAFSA